MNRFSIVWIVWAAFVAVVMSGCVPQAQSSMKTASASHTLEGVHWQLTGFSDHAVEVPQKVWMELEKGRYRGFAGCNGLSGTYRVEGKKISFTMDPSTMMACHDMKGETLFRKRLLESDRYRLTDGMLKFYHGKKALLQFLPSK